MTEQQAYYEYDMTKGGDWWRKEPPRRNLVFEEELTRFSGTNPFGNPVLKAEFGTKIQSDIAAFPQLKYKKLWKGLKGFKYLDGENEILVARPEDAPGNKILLADYGTLELGKLRWIIEAWEPIEHAVANGRFNPETLGEDGKPLYCAPPREGVYNFFFEVQTANGLFRDLGAEVLEAVKDIWHYHLNATPEEKLDDLLKDEQRAKATEREAAREIFL